ncbi:hypothetical protein C815_01119 [Firmicutes bacterium M10-2]|nr:hypothetical protein C815_01119 [Firmicutes bacterium M10-2]
MSENKPEQKKEKIRIFMLGGLDEDGKNMICVEVDQKIYIIEAGIKFPDAKESLGIEYIIQDFTYLIEHKENIAGIIITHGHDDVMGALPHLLKQVKADIYTSPLAAKEITKMLKKEKISGVRIHVVKRHDQKRIAKRKVIFFPITHAYPGAFGVAISTSQGYVVYSGEFIENYNDLDDNYRGNLTIGAKLGKEGVLVLMQESKGAERSGHTSPNHQVTKAFDQILDLNHDTRIFVSVYTQSVYRIQEIIDCCIKHDRKLILYTKELQERMNGLKQIGYKIPEHILANVNEIDKIKDVVVLISGQGRPLFTLMSNIANDEVPNINIRPEDLIVIATPIIPGVEKVFKNMENDIYKRGGRLVLLDKNVLSMHPSKEDLKMMLFLTRPKYYIPVKGEYRMLCANAEIAAEMGIASDHIIILDNGQVAQFEDEKLVSVKMEMQLHDTMIDGKENWDMAGVVLKDREILSTDGVMILAIGIDSKTKKIINGPDVQSRGLIYLKDSQYITNDVAKIMEETIKDNVKNKTYDNLETRQEIRDKVAKYLFKQTAKRPMVLPVILEINQ